jgi:hypothetical protein
MTVPLRPWKQTCLEAQIAHIADGATTFFTAADVGSGKTVKALALYLNANLDIIKVL